MVQPRRGKSASAKALGRTDLAGNQLLRLLPKHAQEAILPALERVELAHDQSLFEPGDNVSHAFFPTNSAVLALVLPMRDGRTVEAATIGREGALGGVVSFGLNPAFARASVQIAGTALRIALPQLEAAKCAAPRIHDQLSRYADCLTAQILQSVGCAALHPLEARAARWLLMTHDRLQEPDLPLTQEAMAEMFGVARTYVTRILSSLVERKAISLRRGVVRIESRPALEQISCECYGQVRNHFERVLRGLYPSVEL